MAKWVRLKKYVQETGEPESSVRAKIAEGVYLERRHYRKDPYFKKIYWMNLEAIEQWLDTAQPRAV